VLEERHFPRKIGVAPRAETADREASVEAHAPHIVGNSAGEAFDANCALTPLS